MAQMPKQYKIAQLLDTVSMSGASLSFDEASVLFSAKGTSIYHIYTVPVAVGAMKALIHSQAATVFSLTCFPHDGRVPFRRDRGDNERDPRVINAESGDMFAAVRKEGGAGFRIQLGPNGRRMSARVFLEGGPNSMNNALRACLSLSAALLAPAIASAFSSHAGAPFTAVYHMVNEEHQADGSVKIVEERWGRYYRTSAGSDLMTVNPEGAGLDAAPYRGTLRDASRAATFDLNYTTRIAVMMQKWPNATPPRLHFPANAGAAETVNGVECVTVPMRGPYIKSGTGCLSTDLNLIVRTDYVTKPDAGGTWKHVVEEYSQIQIGAEPPPGTVAIPAGFQLMTP